MSDRVRCPQACSSGLSCAGTGRGAHAHVAGAVVWVQVGCMGHVMRWW